jgi:hypothetical protein
MGRGRVQRGHCICSWVYLLLYSQLAAKYFNTANHCQDLYKPARAEQISAAIFLLFTLNTELIFHFHETKK